MKLSCKSGILSEKYIKPFFKKYLQELKIYDQSFNYTKEDFAGYCTSISREQAMFFCQFNMSKNSVLSLINVCPRHSELLRIT